MNSPSTVKPQAVKMVLMAADMERAVAFYRDVMGFEESFITPHWSELRFGDAVLGLHGGGDGSRVPTGLSIQYADVAQAYADALAAGATAIQAPEQRGGEPIILATVVDPEGNIIMLTQYVG
ncbi:VOC family protein [Luteolibacter sp. LG18]|uniref:VOC family protein n=1 Tax=Luteolibacter sp. LG18 TaxID=2819286 RepID=UPI002B2E1C1E|nr:hypothetical protein llg_17150 [Luteolibacter sp. LG18]